MCLAFSFPACLGDRSLSLAGKWRFALDRADAGVGERWFERALTGTVKLPGSLPAQGIGDDVTVDTKWTGGIVDRSWFTAPEYAKYRQPGNIKVPFWLQPDKYYAGAAWYQRDFEIPEGWRGKRVVLSLERAALGNARVGGRQAIGSNNSAFRRRTNTTWASSPPGKHTLTIRVDNRMIVDVGENSHCISDHTQGQLERHRRQHQPARHGPVWIDDFRCIPDIGKQSAT